MMAAFGGQKYILLSKLVKAALTLLHGFANVERGLSLSGRPLLSNRAAMSERILNAKLCAFDEFDESGH